jgi:hypothetical protein
MTEHIAMVIGILGIIAYLLYGSRDILTKPQGNIQQGVAKILNVKHMGVALYLLSTWLVVFLIGYLVNLPHPHGTKDMFVLLYVISIWLVAAFNILYIAIYIIYLTSSKLMDFKRLK